MPSIQLNSSPMAEGAIDRHPAICPTGARLRDLLRNRDEGSSMIEFALVLPVLLLLLTGIGSFGAAYNNQLTLTRAVGTGGQYLQMIRTTTTDPCKDTLTAIENAAPGLKPSNIGLSLVLNGTTVTANSCSGDQSDLVQGTPVTVTATYPCNLLIYGALFSGGCALSAKVTEYEY